MKKFQFSLDKMLHYKETLLDKEKGTLQHLHAERAFAEERLESNHRQMIETDAALKETARRGASIWELQMLEFQIENARKHHKQLEQELVEINARVEKQLAVVLGLQQEVSGLDKLQEKQQQEYNYNVRRQESENLIEIVTAKHSTAAGV